MKYLNFEFGRVRDVVIHKFMVKNNRSSDKLKMLWQNRPLGHSCEDDIRRLRVWLAAVGDD